MTEQAAPAADAVQQVTTEAVKQLSSDERLKQILVDMVEKAANGMENAVDWTVAQVPDLIHQLLMWNLAINIVWAVINTLILCGIVFLYARAWILTRNFPMDDKMLIRGFGGVITGAIGSIIFYNGIMSHASEALKIYIAPKLWLLEYAVELVQKAT